MTPARLAVLAGALAALAACKDAGGEPSAFSKPVLAKLERAGFAVGKAEAVDAGDYDAHACVRAEVDRLDLLLCEYSAEEEANENRSELLGFGSGATGGAMRASGKIAMVVADRQNVDTSGKRMNRLLGTFSPEPRTGTSSRSRTAASK